MGKVNPALFVYGHVNIKDFFYLKLRVALKTRSVLRSEWHTIELKATLRIRNSKND